MTQMGVVCISVLISVSEIALVKDFDEREGGNTLSRFIVAIWRRHVK